MNTPAPWIVSQRPHTKGPPSTDPADAHLDYFHIEAGRAEEDGGWEISGYMRPADARLIAAAPDLLSSLDPDTLEAIADEIGSEFKHSARAASLRAVAKKQRAAIAKAEGK